MNPAFVGRTPIGGIGAPGRFADDAFMQARIANSSLNAVIRAGALLIAPLVLASCKEGVLDPRGPVGAAEKLILTDATVIMLAVVVPVILLTLAFAWWFRAGNRRA